MTADARADRIRLRLLVALVVVALLASGAAALLWLRDDAQPSGNAAVVDAGATAEVSREVSAAMVSLWSYDYRDLARSRARLGAITTTAFARTYQPIFKRVERLAPATKAVVTATVGDVAVQTLDGDRAVLLVFLDQSARKGASEPVAAGARLRVEAVRERGAWRVSGVTPF